MEIETIDDLCEQLADWIGVYGCCSAGDKADGCYSNNPLCCRMGFTIQLKERIYNAIETDMLSRNLDLNVKYDKHILEYLKEVM